MKKRLVSLMMAVLILTAIVPAAFSVGNAVDFNGHRYERIEEGMTWKQAKKYCEDRGGHLATITSSAEQEAIMQLVKNGEKAQYWLGGTDEAEEGEWEWITGEPWDYWYTTITFNNYQGTEHYLQMERHHWGDESRLGVWNDINNENYISGQEEFFSTENVGIICEYERIGSGWAQSELEKAEEYDLIPEVLEDADYTLPITRLEFAAVAVKTYENLSGTKALPAVVNPFTDCSDTEVLKAYNLGVVNGMSATTFAPNERLSREQAAAMLTRVFKRATIPGWTLAEDTSYPLDFTRPAVFADDANISAYAKESVYFMVANNIINGMGGNKFAPKNTTSAEEAQGYANATREQALAIAVRMVDNLK
ncbi:S-layer homology domain-containing protein [Agathobaculum sp.]|uniref:S-layer homology domain-containing protein n=1 Tax=Agathobaculum sp. TaxID=2048138 RepID=UPI0027B8D355|nr:lectin-like protein [Agathobaculum sp.]